MSNHRTVPKVRRHQYAHALPVAMNARQFGDVDTAGAQEMRLFACDHCGQEVLLKSGPTFLCAVCADPHPIEEAHGGCIHSHCKGSLQFVCPSVDA